MRKTETPIEERGIKIENANKLLKFIGERDRKFFNYKGYFASFAPSYGVRGDKLYYKDEYTKKRMSVERDLDYVRLTNFSHGSTLKGFVNNLSEYIRFEDDKVPNMTNTIGGEGFWAYEKKEAKEIVDYAIELGIMKS